MRKRRQRTILIASLVVLIVVAQFAFFAPVRDLGRRVVEAPVVVANHLANRFHNFASLIANINNLSAENAQLKAANADQLAKLADLQSIQAENDELKKDLNFTQSRSDLRLLAASVLTFSPLGANQALTINKGSADGVALEDPVISSGFLVGKIKNLAPHTAEVWLLNNPNLLTPVVLTQSQTTGILKGGIEGLVVENIPVDAKVTADEPVVTSALEGLYPAGIAVGKVEEVISPKAEIFTSARISSPVDLTNLSTVFVVKQQ